MQLPKRVFEPLSNHEGEGSYSRSQISTDSAVDSMPEICFVVFREIQEIACMLCASSLSSSEIKKVSTRPHDEEYYHFHLEMLEDTVFLACSPGILVAAVEKAIGDIICQLLHLNSTLRIYAYISRQKWAGASRKDGNKQVDDVKINILGGQDMSVNVGNILSYNGLYLQRPVSLQPEQEYQNPHFLRFTGIEPRMQDEDLISGSGDEAEMEEATELVEPENDLAMVLDSLVRSKYLAELAADWRIRTPLKHHQKKALDFMSQREFGPVQPKFSLWRDEADAYNGKTCFEHVITKTRSYETPDETGGGILADDMGLGKTLTMLANIISTLSKAIEFQRGSSIPRYVKMREGVCKIRSKATLILVPSHMLIKSWTDEIRKHINGGLEVNEFHGRGRETNVEAIANAEVVLTTYHTLTAESSKASSPLFRINWFRVILDEAHMIRTSSTQFFGSVARLKADLRWCVTGTPVQNGLEDLGSLVAFLHIPLLETRQEFKQFVIDPFMKGSSSQNELRLLLDSICLRRPSSILGLPDTEEILQEIDFSIAERQQYARAVADMSQEMRRQANLEKCKRSLFGPLEIEMHLRRLCNHGTFEEPWGREEKPQKEKRQGIADQIICKFCEVDLSDALVVNNLCNGHYTTCGHLICSKCLPSFDQALISERSGKESRKCPFCKKILQVDYLASEKYSPQFESQEKRTVSLFCENGISSKINRLIANIETTPSQNKSIIFSSWIRTLDLIEQHLKVQDIRHHRIDGLTPLAARNKILDNFRIDRRIRVLLMTTGTGAVGLNLAVASAVHIFEPQWNPMVETQAIGRVARLGQEKKVSVIRYIMRGTVEQTLRFQQQQKLVLANSGWNTSSEADDVQVAR